MSSGIDYGLGKTNIDTETGIRFGVIPQNELLQAWCDSAEPEYGEPHCPRCGNEAVAGDSEIPLDELADGETESELQETDRDELGYDQPRHCCGDYACDSCRILFDGEDVFGDEPLGHVLDDGEYKATQSGDDRDIFVLKSPYFTRCRYCSPCAPGAGYLTSTMSHDDTDLDIERWRKLAKNNAATMADHSGLIRAYCFGHDWFYDDEHKSAPYPIFSVATGELLSEPIDVDGETRWIAKKQ